MSLHTRSPPIQTAQIPLELPNWGRFVPRICPRSFQRSAQLRPRPILVGRYVGVVVTEPDGARLAGLLDAAAQGRLPARLQAVVPLDDVADAHRSVAKGGVRGAYVLRP